jgi:hypothetical protein
VSRSVDLFIASEADIAEVAHAVAVLAGAISSPGSSEGSFELRRGDVVAELRTHDYVDDGALRFSRYPYVLSARFQSDQSLGDVPEVVFVRHTADLVRQRMDATALVVLDLQQRDPAASRVGGSADEVPE